MKTGVTAWNIEVATNEKGQIIQKIIIQNAAISVVRGRMP